MTRFDPGPVRVLHVDDDPAFLDLAARFLEREREYFEVRTAAIASEGLDHLEPDLDCVVSDYRMPAMDGLEFLQAVRAERPELPFILFTSADPDPIANAAGDELTTCLSKGSGREQYVRLADRIDLAVSRDRNERGSRQSPSGE